MTQKLKQGVIQSLKIAFAGGLIYFLVASGRLDFKSVWGIASDPTTLALLLLFSVLAIWINNLRWAVLLQGQGFKVSSWSLLPLTFIGLFFNYFIPGGVGGDVVKGYYVVQDHPEQKYAAALSILMDRLIGFFIMTVTALVSVALNWQKVSASPEMLSLSFGVAALCLAFGVFFALSFSRWIQSHPKIEPLVHRFPGGAKIWKIYTNLHAYRHALPAFFQACVLSFFSQGCMIAFVYSVGQWLHVSDMTLSMYLFVVPLGLVAQAIPLAPAGIGVGQVAFFILVKMVLGRESSLGATAVTAMQILQLGFGLLGAGFYLQRKKQSPSVATAPLGPA